MPSGRSRLGVMFTCNRPPEELAAGIKLIETLGFDDCWLVEDLSWGGGIASTTAALCHSSNLRIGLGIMPAMFRNSAATAMEVSTIARLFPDRFVAGIGHGVTSWMAKIGEKQRSPLRTIEEVTVNVRALVRGDRVSFAGDVITIDDVQLVHPARSIPPVMLGVVGPKSLHISGRIADGTILSEWAGPTYIESARRAIDEGRQAANRNDNHEIVVFVNTMFSDDNLDARMVMRNAFAPKVVDGSCDKQLGPAVLAEILSIRGRCNSFEEAAEAIPEWIVDELSAAGTHDQGRVVRPLHLSESHPNQHQRYMSTMCFRNLVR